jgi:hypothetical protein
MGPAVCTFLMSCVTVPRTRVKPPLRASEALRGVVLGTVAALLLGGCAATRATLSIIEAQDQLELAREQGAQEVAIYEMTMAQRYLQKAWEEVGTSDYGVSVALSKKSAEWSDQAIIRVQEGAREVELDLAGVKDAPGPPTVPSTFVPDPTLDPEAKPVEPPPDNPFKQGPEEEPVFEDPPP